MLNTNWRIGEKDFWISDKTVLFRSDLSDTEVKIYCPNVAIEAIEWKFTKDDIKICTYCKQQYEGIECPGCNSRVPDQIKSFGRAQVTLQGLLPKSIWLLDIRSTTILEIHYVDCGPRDQYCEEEAIIIMSQCETIEKSIPFPVAYSPGDEDAMTAIAVITCNIEIWERERR